MKPFRSAEEMLDAHEAMFGEAGRQCAEVVIRWAETLFAVPLDALNIRIVLAPVELGPYNRHAGYHYGQMTKACSSSATGTSLISTRAHWRSSSRMMLAASLVASKTSFCMN